MHEESRPVPFHSQGGADAVPVRLKNAITRILNRSLPRLRDHYLPQKAAQVAICRFLRPLKQQGQHLQWSVPRCLRSHMQARMASPLRPHKHALLNALSHVTRDAALQAPLEGPQQPGTNGNSVPAVTALSNPGNMYGLQVIR